METGIQTNREDATIAAGDTAVKSLTVGVFDSGIGGFTVVKQILSRRPDLNLLYFGDSLNVPYGGRPLQQLSRFASNSINFLKGQGMDILAVGCNASNSVLGQGELHSFGIRVFDLVSSTIERMQSNGQVPQRLALVATVASINSGYWQRKLHEFFPDLDVLAVPAPEFVPLVESEGVQESAIRTAVSRVLKPCLDQGYTTILHGCTHYPLLQDYMEALSGEFSFIDPAVCLAECLTEQLPEAVTGLPAGWRRFYSSLPGQAFYRTASNALGFPIENMTRMYIVNPYED